MSEPEVTVDWKRRNADGTVTTAYRVIVTESPDALLARAAWNECWVKPLVVARGVKVKDAS